jgi:hypothetical protein
MEYVVLLTSIRSSVDGRRSEMHSAGPTSAAKLSVDRRSFSEHQLSGDFYEKAWGEPESVYKPWLLVEPWVCCFFFPNRPLFYPGHTFLPGCGLESFRSSDGQ